MPPSKLYKNGNNNKGDKDNNRQPVVFGAASSNSFFKDPVNHRRFIVVALAFILALLFQFSGEEGGVIADYKVGDIAKESLFAPRDILVVDTKATASKKEMAAENTWPVFDFDTSLATKLEQRIRAVFAEARGFYQKEWDWNEAERLRLAGRGGRGNPLPFIPDEDYSDREAGLKKKFMEITADIDNKTFSIDDKSWAELKKDKFSRDAENNIVTLFMQVMNDGVVLTKDELPTESGQGITVRILPHTGSGDEFPKGDVSSMNSLSDSLRIIRERGQNIGAKDMSPVLRKLIISVAQQLVRPNYTYNKAQSQVEVKNAQEAVPEAYFQIKKGEKIFRQGDFITPEIREKLELLRRGSSTVSAAALFIGNFIWLLTLFVALYAFAYRNIRKFNPTTTDIIQMILQIVFFIGMLKLALVWSGSAGNERALHAPYLIPLMAAAMMVRLVLNSEVALVFAAVLSFIAAVLARDAALGLYFLIGSVIGAMEVGQARSRGVLAKAGLITGLVNVVVILSISLAEGNLIGPNVLYNCIMGLAAGIFAGFITLGITPLLETTFGYVTDIRLLELANQEHPLMKALIMNASGTYQHSVTVGILAEEAAKAIHVNPLAAKVASLYHDVGKMEKPAYFVENQRDLGNPHDKLTPSMSSLILSSHVKYGMELAKMYRLPHVILDSITQHHGSSLMKYFYARAKEREDPDLSPVVERDYRYPGPKPQTREAGIIMLADSVEAAARSLSDPTPVKLRNMVRKIINAIFMDGQLDDCELTLKDLNAIAEAFINVLTSMYHSRPEYPEIPAERTENGRKKDSGENSGGESGNENGQEGKGTDQKAGDADTVRVRV